jgi:hypothetical protein
LHRKLELLGDSIPIGILPAAMLKRKRSLVWNKRLSLRMDNHHPSMLKILAA